MAAVRRHGSGILFITTLTSEAYQRHASDLPGLLRSVGPFIERALGITAGSSHFVMGRHGHEFPRYLMAKTAAGDGYIVEPDHPAPLVEVRPPKASASKAPKLTSRFDTVTQWRLAQMRKYYQQFADRQRTAPGPGSLVVPVHQ